jgi:hypothetical protein
MAKQRSAQVKCRPRFKGAYLKGLGGRWVFDKDGKTHVTMGGLLFFYAGSGQELKHIDEGKTVLPRDGFVSPYGACGRKERPKREKWKCGLPYLMVTSVLSLIKTLAVSTAAPSTRHTRAPAGASFLKKPNAAQLRSPELHRVLK